MSEKKGLIPIVAQEIGYAVQAEMLQNPGYEEELLERLMAEDNPIVARFITNFSQNLPAQASEAAIYAGLLVYRLIESQSEANRLRQDFSSKV